MQRFCEHHEEQIWNEFDERIKHLRWSTNRAIKGINFHILREIFKRTCKGVWSRKLQQSGYSYVIIIETGQDESRKSIDPKLYRNMINSLLHRTASKPDIYYSVHAFVPAFDLIVRNRSSKLLSSQSLYFNSLYLIIFINYPLFSILFINPSNMPLKSSKGTSKPSTTNLRVAWASVSSLKQEFIFTSHFSSYPRYFLSFPPFYHLSSFCWATFIDRNTLSGRLAVNVTGHITSWHLETFL